MTSLSPILGDIVGRFEDLRLGIVLANLLYHHEIGVRLPDGTVDVLTFTMRDAAQEVETFFIGPRPDQIKLSPGYEYALWLWYFDDPPKGELLKEIDLLVNKLCSHPGVEYVRRSY